MGSRGKLLETEPTEHIDLYKMPSESHKNVAESILYWRLTTGNSSSKSLSHALSRH